MSFPNSPIATSPFMRDMGRGYDEFDFVAAWQKVRPLWDTMPQNVRDLFVYTRKVAGHLHQAKDLSMPWPGEEETLHEAFDPLMGTLCTRFSKVPGEFLEPAMEIVYALGHWLPSHPLEKGEFVAPKEDILLFRGEPADGCYWKFAHYAMQSLIERGHQCRQPHPEESSEERAIRKLREKYGDSEGGAFYIYDTIGVPHPYCITARHLQLADSMVLDKTSIVHAENRGATCGVRGCQLPFDKHERALVIACTKPMSVGKGEFDPELKAFILRIKEQTEKDGYAGWAFKRMH